MEKKLLIVDDQPKFTRMMGIKLEKMGYTVFTAENGETALEIAKMEKPNLIVMDIMMPVMDGFAAAAELNNDPDTAQIPLIFLSAKGQPADRERATALGALDFLSKPFNPSRLVARIEEHFVS